MTDLPPSLSTFAALLAAHLCHTAGAGSPSRCGLPSTTAWPS
jgi:hypothetical protein